VKDVEGNRLASCMGPSRNLIRETAGKCEDIKSEIQTMYSECKLAILTVNRPAQTPPVYWNKNLFHDSVKQSFTKLWSADHEWSVKKLQVIHPIFLFMHK
jgi:hypothetical protein